MLFLLLASLLYCVNTQKVQTLTKTKDNNGHIHIDVAKSFKYVQVKRSRAKKQKNRFGQQNNASFGGKNNEQLDNQFDTHLNNQLNSQMDPQCPREFTMNDQEGPFYLDRDGQFLRVDIAPSTELQDPTKAVFLHGRVWDRNCQPIRNARVEVWYAGPTKGNYTFGIGHQWYRGKQKTDLKGDYHFLASFPIIYPQRPVIHYHFKVWTPGPMGMEFTTQAYFEDMLPPWRGVFEGRNSNMAIKQKMDLRTSKKRGLQNGGREITFNIKLNTVNDEKQPCPPYWNSDNMWQKFQDNSDMQFQCNTE